MPVLSFHTSLTKKYFSYNHRITFNTERKSDWLEKRYQDGHKRLSWTRTDVWCAWSNQTVPGFVLSAPEPSPVLQLPPACSCAQEGILGGCRLKWYLTKYCICNLKDEWKATHLRKTVLTSQLAPLNPSILSTDAGLRPGKDSLCLWTLNKDLGTSPINWEAQ